MPLSSLVTASLVALPTLIGSASIFGVRLRTLRVDARPLKPEKDLCTGHEVTRRSHRLGEDRVGDHVDHLHVGVDARVVGLAGLELANVLLNETAQLVIE